MKHTPMKSDGTVVYVKGGGFDLRGCPEPEVLSSDIARACNAHDELVAALDKAIQYCEICDHLEEVEIDGKMVDAPKFRRNLKAILRKATTPKESVNA